MEKSPVEVEVELEVKSDQVEEPKTPKKFSRLLLRWKSYWDEFCKYSTTDGMKKTYRAIVSFGISILFCLVRRR
jgi:hypothetical protein